MPIQLKVGVQKYVEYYIEKKISIGVSIATVTKPKYVEYYVEKIRFKSHLQQ